MAEECFVCVSKFTKINKQFCCLNPECKLEVCSKCARTYILNSSAEPHCMECKTALPTSFLVKNFPKSFITGEFRKSRHAIYIEQQTARIGETMEVIQYKKDLDKEGEIVHKKQDALKNEINSKLDAHSDKALRALFAKERKNIIKQKGDVANYDKLCEMQLEENEKILAQLKAEQSEIYRDANREYALITEKQEVLYAAIVNPAILKSANPQKAGKYLMKCAKPECAGIVKADNMSCAICGTIYCNECLTARIDGHTCNKEDIKTAKEILLSTKPCPRCATLIYKIDGCDQMWCVSCHTAFSWESGIITLNNIHNPHYFQWLNQNKNRDIQIRVVGDEACGGILHLKDSAAQYQFVVSLLNVIKPEHIRGMFRFGGYTKDDHPSFSLPKPIIDEYKQEIGKIIDTNCTLELCNKQITAMISLYNNVMDTLNRYYRNNRTNPEQSAYEKTLNRSRYEFLLGKMNRDKYEKIIYETNTDKQYDDECATLFEMFASCGVNYINACIQKHNDISIRLFNMTNEQVKKESVNYRNKRYGFSSTLYYYTAAKYEDYGDDDNMKYSAFVMKLIGSIMTAQKSMKFESTNEKRLTRYREVKMLFYQNLMHQLVASKEGYKEIIEHKRYDTPTQIEKYEKSFNILSDFINILREFISDETDELVFVFIEDYYKQVRNKSWCDEYHTMVAELKDLCEQTNGLIDYVSQTYKSITEIHNKGTSYFGYGLCSGSYNTNKNEFVVTESTGVFYLKCIPHEYYMHNHRRRLTEFATPFVVSDEEQRAFNERVNNAKNFETATTKLFQSDYDLNQYKEVKSTCKVTDKNTVVACCFARFKFNNLLYQCGTVIQKGGEYVKFTPDYPTFPFEIDTSHVKAVSSPINLWVNSQKFDEIDSWDGLAGYINSRVNLPMIANMSSRYIVTNDMMTEQNCLTFFEKLQGVHSGANTLLWDDLVSFCFVNNFSIVQKYVQNHAMMNSGRAANDLFENVLNEQNDPTLSRKLLFGCASSILNRVMWINVNDYLFANIGSFIVDVKLFGLCCFMCIKADKVETNKMLKQTVVIEKTDHKQVFVKADGDSIEMDSVYYISRKSHWNVAEQITNGVYFAVKDKHYISDSSSDKNNAYNKTTVNGCQIRSNIMRIKGASIEPKMMYSAMKMTLKMLKEENELLLADKAEYEKLKRKYLA